MCSGEGRREEYDDREGGGGLEEGGARMGIRKEGEMREGRVRRESQHDMKEEDKET